MIVFKLEIELVLNDFNSHLRVPPSQTQELSHVLNHPLVDPSLIRGQSLWTKSTKEWFGNVKCVNKNWTSKT